jgi:L-malate glycosyltransferase
VKILQIIQKPQLRGAEMFAAQLGNHLLSLGHSCHLVSIFPGDESLPFSGTFFKLDRPLSKRLWDLQGWKKLAELVNKEKPDVIQLNAGDTLKFAVSSKIIFGWNTRLIFRNASLPSLYIKNRFSKIFNAYLYNQVDAIASVSQKSRNDLNKLFPKTQSKSVVIPIGIEPEPPGVKEKKKDYPTFVHVGGFTFEKNHSGLINIFENLKLQFPAAHLWLIGDGPLRPDIEELVSSKNLRASVTFFGFVKNPMRFVAAADVLLMTSIIEGLPAVIMEAMLCRCPVVTYDTGGVSEVIENRKTGFVVAINDDRKFIDAVSDALSDTRLREEVISNASDFVRSRFDNRQIALRFTSFYQQVLGSKPEHD